MKNKKIFAISLIVGLITVVFFAGWVWNKKTNDTLEYARVLLRAGRYGTAIAILEGNPWLIRTGKNYALVYSLALTSKKIANTSDFSELEEKIVKINIEKLEKRKLNGSETWELGFIYENLDNKEKALDCYVKVLNSNFVKGKRDVSNLLSDIAHIYEAINDRQKANEYYKKSIDEDGTNLVAKWRYMLRVLNIKKEGDREEAKMLAREIVESQDFLVFPVKEDSYNLLGRICLEEKRGTEDSDCLKYFEESLKINDSYVNTYDSLIGYFLLKETGNDMLFVFGDGKIINEDRKSKLFDYINKSMNINNSRAVTFFYISVTEDLLGKKESAREWLRKALILIDNDNTLWGESKNLLRSYVYFKLASLRSDRGAMENDLNLAIKNNAGIKKEILELAQNNPEDLRIKEILAILDK